MLIKKSTTVLCLLTILLLVFSSINTILASNEVEFYLKPTLDVTLYPDGSLGLHYELDVNIKLPPGKPMKGLIDFTAEYYEDENSITFLLTGAGELSIGNTSGTALREIHELLRGTLRVLSSEDKREAIVNASLSIKHEERTLKELISKTSLNISKLTFIVHPELINTYFNMSVSGINITIPMTNVSELINEELKKLNITYVEFKNVSVKSYDNIYVISGVLTINISKLILLGVEKGIIAHEEAEEISYCLNNVIKDFKGDGEFASDFVTSYFLNGSKIFVKHGSRVKLFGDVAGYRGVLERCSLALTKLMYIASLITAPPPEAPYVAIPPTDVLNITTIPKLVPTYPFGAMARIRAEFTETSVNIKIIIDVNRFTYVEIMENPADTLRESLKELRNYLTDIWGKFAFLEMMGVSPPIPKKVRLHGASLNGKKVIIMEEVIDLFSLPEAKFRVVEEIIIPPPTTPPPSTIVITVTQTQPPITYTVIITATETITETLITTHTLTTTQTTTVTYTPPETQILNIALTAALIMLIIILLIIILVRRK